MSRSSGALNFHSEREQSHGGILSVEPLGSAYRRENVIPHRHGCPNSLLTARLNHSAANVPPNAKVFEF